METQRFLNRSSKLVIVRYRKNQVFLEFALIHNQN